MEQTSWEGTAFACLVMYELHMICWKPDYSYTIDLGLVNHANNMYPNGKLSFECVRPQPAQLSPSRPNIWRTSGENLLIRPKSLFYTI